MAKNIHLTVICIQITFWNSVVIGLIDWMSVLSIWMRIIQPLIRAWILAHAFLSIFSFWFFIKSNQNFYHASWQNISKFLRSVLVKIFWTFALKSFLFYNKKNKRKKYKIIKKIDRKKVPLCQKSQETYILILLT